MVLKLGARQIDTNKPMLDDVASGFFGRLFIAMIVRASHMRFQKGGSMPPVYLVVDEAHEYFDRSISDMLEQAMKANIGLIVAHQSLSQAKGRDGGGNIADPLMVNTATKIVWTTFREDAAKFAGSMQISPDQILTLPQFTFGMYSRNRGFTPIRGRPNALGDIQKRDDPNELQEFMEKFYGPSKDAPKAPDPTAETQPMPEIETAAEEPDNKPAMNGSVSPHPPSDDNIPEEDII